MSRTDYRALLGRVEERALPWLEGDSVDAPERRLRLTARPARAGWWRFRIEGRRATPIEEAERPEEAWGRLARLSGHLLGGRLVLPGAEVEPLWLLPEEEPPRLAPCRARRWASGDLLFDELLFESEAEEGARRALEDGRGLASLSGVPATLRAAFGYAVAEAAAARIGARVSPLEVRGRCLELAEGGSARAGEVIAALVAERQRAEARRTLPRRPVAAPVEAGPQRIGEVLENVGARLLGVRRLGQGLLEVRWRFLGGRFVSLVRADTLQVVDAGICLAGADHLVTLESLPGVIREATEEGSLVMTRWEDDD